MAVRHVGDHVRTDALGRRLIVATDAHLDTAIREPGEVLPHARNNGCVSRHVHVERRAAPCPQRILGDRLGSVRR